MRAFFFVLSFLLVVATVEERVVQPREVVVERVETSLKHKLERV